MNFGPVTALQDPGEDQIRVTGRVQRLNLVFGKKRGHALGECDLARPRLSLKGADVSRVEKELARKFGDRLEPSALNIAVEVAPRPFEQAAGVPSGKDFRRLQDPMAFGIPRLATDWAHPGELKYVFHMSYSVTQITLLFKVGGWQAGGAPLG